GRGVHDAVSQAYVALAGFVPLALSVVCAVLISGSMNLYDISMHQGVTTILQDGLLYERPLYLHHWLVFHDPCNFVACVIFWVAAMASCRRGPFELGRTVTGVDGGYWGQFAGVRAAF